MKHILLSFALPIAAGWGPLPERVPLHYDADGTPDGWGTRGTTNLIVAIGMLTSISMPGHSSSSLKTCREMFC